MQTGNLTHAVACSAVAVILLAACSEPPPAKYKPPAPPGPRSCGEEIAKKVDDYNAMGRSCIWEAYKARDPAQFTTTRYTIEGDPITYTITVTRKGVDVVVDSKDRLGQQGVFRHTCRTFEQIFQDGNKGRFGFALTGCTGGGAQRVAVP
ncbi:MAG: hypothetical protein IT372_32135 [Polyangiaceae bacterium]|nr:hypothetical protein [Polyangiaceae bacterium]